MAIFKCKMCGGDLEVADGVTIIECEYCGTKQTVPRAMADNIQSMFNRANTLRMKSEFDKAAQIYEQIIQSGETQSEAYWGLILCKYGIEYVNDPMTLRKIPTCHRASYDSVIADADYKSAIETADISQRAIYEDQAREIDRIQKDILALAQKEETYDVFICYKETDAEGRRTQDSVIANDIYYQLTQAGFKVFYAAITLEGKLGSAYEPIIFAALHSAKVMLTIGTKPEYFNAVWVKNEWSRYLKIIKKDRSKLLIPCYRDMDAYELPVEFAHLQAQDMSKIGFISDLIRGIQKVIVKDVPKPATVVKETVANTAMPANIAPLLERMSIFLEDGEWDRAYEFCEQILNIEPKCAEAYLGKLMIELGVKRSDALKDVAEPFDQNGNYQKVIRFADEALKATLEGYIAHINARNEQNRCEGIYNYALSIMNNAKNENDYKAAAEGFNSISGYKDADALAVEAETRRKDAVLDMGMAKLNSKGIASCVEAKALFSSISGWKDADERIEECERKRVSLIKKRKKLIATCSAIFCALIAFVIVFNTVILPAIQYNSAMGHIEDGEYRDAYEILLGLGDYEDTKEYLFRFEVIYDKETVYTDGELNYTLEYKYDSDGNLLSRVEKDAYGKVKYSYEYKYDSAGHRVSEVEKDAYGKVTSSEEYKYDSAGKQLSYKYNSVWYGYSYEYKYDSAGHQVSKVKKDADGKVEYSIEYKYDSDGNRLSGVNKDADGKITSFYEYKYDSDGNQLSFVEKDADGKITSSYEYKYDSDGNMVEDINIYYDDYGKVEYSYESKYDSDGNQLSFVRKDADGKVEYSYEYKYDSNGNRVSEVWKDADGKIKGSYEREYDSRGNLLEEERKSRNSETDELELDYSYKYEYDSVGNCLKKESKKPNSETGEIEVTYYEYKYEGIRVLYTPKTK